MPIKKAEKIWFNGNFVSWDDAHIHVLSHVIHYGSSVFEGIRCYHTNKGSAVFRLGPHVARLLNSAKIYRMEVPYSAQELERAILDTVRENRMKECYIRPVVFRGYGEIGVNPLSCPIDAVIAVWEWGKYLGKEALEQGVEVCVSSWNRMAPNTIPALAKAAANYMNSQLIKMEAILNGFSEGIALDPQGYVSEGSGENIFLIKDETIYTPPLVSSILQGVTRSSVIQICQDLGFRVQEQPVPREFLYVADEIFFTGTAAEVTPVRSVDKIKVGKGSRGPLTAQIQERFFGIVSGTHEDRHNWLTFVG
ncbi:MAG: branched-chain amino acid transaminase [Acidobacteriota bacterium]